MKKIITAALLALPMFASAQQLTGTKQLIAAIGNIVQTLTIIAAAIALLVFFWGLAKFILKVGNEDAVDDGKRLMMWGLIALFVMVSVWGLVNFFQRELGLPQNSTVLIPSTNLNVNPLYTGPSAN